MRPILRATVSLLGLSLWLCHCTAKKSGTAAPEPNPAVGQTPIAPAGPSPVISSGAGSQTQALPGQIDIIVVDALAGVQNSISSTTKDQIQKLLQGLYTKASASGGKYHVGLISPKSGPLSALGFPGSDPSTALSVDFSLKAIDLLLVSVIVGCDRASTAFPDPHVATSTPKICGSDLLSLAGNTRDKLLHSWIWALEPVRESLKSILRAGAQRVFIFISPSNPEFLDITSWQQLISAQGAPTVKVHAIASAQDGPKGECTLDVKAAPTVLEFAQKTGGQVIDYCATDWSAGIQAIMGSIP